MSTGTEVLQPPESTSKANRKLTCPLYGCKRVYGDRKELDSHIKDHDIPAESVAGKLLLCSAIGCSGSFPSMQKLMEHQRHHHKPNLFFLCESCRAKLRSYRGLLTHLHTCSKVPRSKLKTVESALFSTSDREALEGDHKAPASPPGPPEAAPATAPPPMELGGTPPPDGVPGHQQGVEGASPQQSPAAGLEPPVDPEALGQLPRSPPVAIWRKNPGMTGGRRVLWEHTRGRYRCVQCGHAVANRRDMTSHINTHRNAAAPATCAGDTGMAADN